MNEYIFLDSYSFKQIYLYFHRNAFKNFFLQSILFKIGLEDLMAQDMIFNLYDAWQIWVQKGMS